MKSVQLTCLALIWAVVGAYGQDLKRIDNAAADWQESLKASGSEHGKADVNASLLRHLTSVSLAGVTSTVQDRTVEPQQNGRSKVSLEFGMDLVSRYVWRGIDYGDAPAFQPYASVSIAGFEFGAWGSYAFGAPAGAPPFSENELYLEYTYSASVGTFTATISDYYFPSDGLKFFNYRRGNEGAHTLELCFGYGGTQEFPLNLVAAANVHNDTSNSVYFEAGYSFEVEGVSVNAFVGGTRGESAWYEVEDKGFRVINVGLTFSKSIPISSSFSLPVSVSVGVNPYAEQSILVFKIGL